MEFQDERRQVALVDDDPDFQAVIREWLLPEFDTVSFADGEELLEGLDEIVPAVIIMDIGLPGPSGVSLCSRLRKMRRFAGVPILFLTGYGPEGVFQECMLAGGTEFLTKPVEMGTLVAAVRRLAEEVPAYG